MNFKVEKVSGAFGEKYACGVFSKHLNISEEISGVFASCVLLGGDGLSSIENVNTYLQEAFENDSKKLVEGGEDILRKIGEVRDSARERLVQMSIDAEFVIAFFYKDAVYIARAGNKVKVTVFRPPKSFNVEFELGSGRLVSGDLVLIGTEKFSETFDTGTFASSDEVIFEDVIDGLLTDISALDEQSEVGALFVQVGGKKHDSEKNVGHGEEPHKAPAVEKIEDVQKTDSELRPVPERKLLASILSGITSEFKKLKVGDIGALFRLRRNLMFVAILLILILGVSGFVTVKGKMDLKKNAQISEHLTIAESKYAEAVGILDLNKEKARQLLVEAEAQVNSALAISGENERALKLKAQITEALKGTENLASINFETFWDGSGSVAGFSKGDGSFYAFSGSGVYEIDEAGEDSEVSGVNADGGGFVFNNNLFVLSGGNVLKLDFNGGEDEVGRISNARDISVFFGNVYLLGDNQILKFVPIADGYAQGTDYLENSLSFGSESRFAIDGSIWVTNGKEILKFTRGVSDNFSFSGVNGAGNFGEIYTNADSSKIYVIDRDNSALLVIGKDGLYEKSYNSSEFKKASDLFVDEEEGKMYIATGSKILRADL